MLPNVNDHILTICILVLFKYTWLGRGCGAVGRAVASDTRDPWFKSQHHKKNISNVSTYLSIWKIWAKSLSFLAMSWKERRKSIEICYWMWKSRVSKVSTALPPTSRTWAPSTTRAPSLKPSRHSRIRSSTTPWCRSPFKRPPNKSRIPKRLTQPRSNGCPQTL